LRLSRHPDLLLWWSRKGLVVRNLESGMNLLGGSSVAALLGVFDVPRTVGEAVRSLPAHDPDWVREGVASLARHGFLVPARARRRRVSRIDAWKGNAATALYHAACRDMRYVSDEAAYIKERVLPEKRPALFTRYRVPARRKLGVQAPSGTSLETALEGRRTVRDFRRQPVSISDLAGIVRGTWGMTGCHDAGLLGSLLTKTSPSAGSLHPIECYVLAWNVRGLEPGLYHYDVGADELRRLRRGRLRAEAVRAASGQTWVGRAGFLCVMTAVFGRSLWKYQDETAYRTLFLDAGHLGQTFCLLATARGLGPFTTAAIQDSYIEKLIGLDGLKEFPLYLCGAGVPAKRLP
jgi:SagB-type dehydrogenase family enzyme